MGTVPEEIFPGVVLPAPPRSFVEFPKALVMPCQVILVLPSLVVLLPVVLPLPLLLPPVPEFANANILNHVQFPVLNRERGSVMESALINLSLVVLITTAGMIPAESVLPTVQPVPLLLLLLPLLPPVPAGEDAGLVRLVVVEIPERVIAGTAQVILVNHPQNAP